MNRRKNILMLIPNMDFGGAQRAFYYLSRELGHHHQVYECVFNTERGIAYAGENKLYDLNIPAGTNFLMKGVRFIQRVIKVRELKKALGIDLTISMLEGADHVNILSRYCDQVWLCVQGSKRFDQDMKYENISKKLLIPFLYKKADKIIAVSEGIKEELIVDFKADPEKIRVIENAVDQGMVNGRMKAPLPTVYEKIFSTYKVIITAGRLHEQKNQLPLFDVFDRLHADDPTLKMVVIGDGPLKSDMERKAEGYSFKTWFSWHSGAPDSDTSFFFLGFQENPFQYIHHSKLFILSSLWEGYPLALLEAMACGVPVLAADCPTGPRQILNPDKRKNTYDITAAEKGKYGILLPLIEKENYENSVNQWYQTIMNLLKDTEGYESYRKLAISRSRAFSVEAITQKWKDEITKQ